MIDTSMRRELVDCLDRMPVDQQQRVLQFARLLSGAVSQGTMGETFLQFSGAIAPADLCAMSAAIQRDCERVDADEW